MSTDELDKYKEIYAALISEFAALHNAHLSFIKYVGRDTGFETRKHLRAIANLADDLKRQGQKVCKESIENNRRERIRLREEKRNRKNKNKNALDS